MDSSIGHLIMIYLQNSYSIFFLVVIYTNLKLMNNWFKNNFTLILLYLTLRMSSAIFIKKKIYLQNNRCV